MVTQTMQDMPFRQATADDAAAIRTLTRAAYAKWVSLIGREPRPMTADYDKAVHDHRFDLLEIDGKLAALIETVIQADHLVIENIAVDPSYQGHGIGRRLIAHAEQFAASSGLAEVRLYTNQRFAENIRLYIKLGYRINREEMIGDGIAVHMNKHLLST